MSNKDVLNESTVSRFKVLAGIEQLQEQVLPTGPIPEDTPETMGAPIPGLEKAPPGLPSGLMGDPSSAHQVKAGQGYWHVAKALGLPTNSRTFRKLRNLVRGGVGRGSTVLKTSMVFEKAPDGSISVSRPGAAAQSPGPSVATQPEINPFAGPVLFPGGGTTDIADVEGALNDPEVLPPGERVVRRTPDGGFEEVSNDELNALKARERAERVRRNTILRDIGEPSELREPIRAEDFQAPRPDPAALNQLYQDLVAGQSAPQPAPQTAPVPMAPVSDPSIGARERQAALQYPGHYKAAFQKMIDAGDPAALARQEEMERDPVTDEMLRQIGIRENQEKIVDKIADILIEYLSEK